jgi:hypothetical protein
MQQRCFHVANPRARDRQAEDGMRTALGGMRGAWCIAQGAKDTLHTAPGVLPSARCGPQMTRDFPHALIVAPTGRGKTTGFVIPNLLTWQGSAVTLDVKGECFEATARHRAAQGRQGLSLCPHRLGGQAHASLQPALAHLSAERSRAPADGIAAPRDALPAE